MSAVAAARAQRSLPSLPPLTLFCENDNFQIRCSATDQFGVDRLIAILDAALEIVEESDIHSQDDESSIVSGASSVVIGQSPSQNRRNIGDRNNMNNRGQGRMGSKTSQRDRGQ
jgi:hypothetical protein